MSVAGYVLTALSGNAPGFEVDGETITPGGAAVTISGTRISLNASKSLVVGSSTVAFATSGSNIATNLTDQRDGNP